MYIISCILLLNLINNVFATNNVCLVNYYYTQHMRNTGFRIVIFKEKTIPKMMKKLQFFYEQCCYKSIASIGEGVCEYLLLAEEERTLIESVISLCY